MKIKQFAMKAAAFCLLLTGLANAQVGPDIVVHQLGVDGGNTSESMLRRMLHTLRGCSGAFPIPVECEVRF